MFLIIITIAVVTGILFFTALTSLIIFLYSIVNKNDKLKNKNLKVLITSAIVFVLLIVVDIILLVNYLSKNKEDLLDKAVRIPAEMTGKGFALTFQSFEKNWDKNRLEQLKNLRISFSSMDYEVQDETKIYDIEFIFDNTSPAEIKLYLDDILKNHYLLVCDKDDFVYTLPLEYTTIRKTLTSEQT